MAITASGYDGTVDEVEWSRTFGLHTAPYVVRGPGDYAVTSVAGADRTVRIAPGVAGAFGVTVTSDAAETKQLDVVASGNRWDTVVIRRSWPGTAGTTTLEVVKGSNIQAVSADLQRSPGTGADDQAIALVQVTAGQQLPTGFVDLRAWSSPLVMAGSLQAIPDVHARLGLVVRLLGGLEYRRQMVGNVPQWVLQTPEVREFVQTATSGSASGIVDALVVGLDVPAVTTRVKVDITASIRARVTGSADFAAILRRAPLGQLGNNAATKVDLDLFEVKATGGSLKVAATLVLNPGDRPSIGVWLTRLAGSGTADVEADAKQNRLTMVTTPYPVS